MTNDDMALLQTIVELRNKLRETNRERGRQSLTLHLTRLERDKARTQDKKHAEEAAAQTQYARRLYFLIRELFEAVRPGMEHGELDNDYKDVLGSIRRMRAIVADLEHELATTTELLAAPQLPPTPRPRPGKKAIGEGTTQ